MRNKREQMWVGSVALCLLGAVYLNACGAKTASTQQTLRQSLSVATAGLIAAYGTTADLLMADKLSVEKAKDVRTQLQRVEVLLTAARNVVDTDPTKASNYLATLNQILIPLLSELTAAQTGKVA